MALKKTHYTFPGQTAYYKGKVRDVYTIDDKLLVMVVTDRISAFDVVLPEPIPFKGQVLNQIAAQFLKSTEDILPNWIVSVPDANVTIGRKCEPFKVEMVIRGYLAGSAWRAYRSGIRTICGVTLPDGLVENQKLETPIITPTTKASEGHDEEISREEIIEQGIVSESDYTQLENFTRQIFQRGTDIAANRGLILVDTKYEFGKIGETIYLIDEIHTPDSSRYFYADSYQELFKKGLPQRQLSKEFVREWLMENGFQGKEGQNVPEMTPEIIQSITSRYVELFEKLIGASFEGAEQNNIEDRIFKNIHNALLKLS